MHVSPSPRWAVWRWFENWHQGEIHSTGLVLIRCPWFQVMLNWYHQPDVSDAAHNHPFWFLTFVLKGEYCEFVGTPYYENGGWCLRNCKTKVVRFIDFKRRCVVRKVVLVQEGGATFLTITGPRSNDWGFYEQGDFVSREGIPVTYIPWMEYLYHDRSSTQR